MNLSIVIPVYRGEHLLVALVERIASTLPQIAENFEVILVNDGSPDNSWGVIEHLAARYAWLRGIRLMRNYGQHNATLCGVREARFEITVTMDQGLQHPRKTCRSCWPNWKKALMSSTARRARCRRAGCGTG